MQSGLSQDDIIGSGDIHYQEVHLYISCLVLVPEVQWEVDDPYGVHFLSPETQDGVYQRKNFLFLDT